MGAKGVPDHKGSREVGVRGAGAGTSGGRRSASHASRSRAGAPTGSMTGVVHCSVAIWLNCAMGTALPGTARAAPPCGAGARGAAAAAAATAAAATGVGCVAGRTALTDSVDMIVWYGRALGAAPASPRSASSCCCRPVHRFSSDSMYLRVDSGVMSTLTHATSALRQLEQRGQLSSQRALCERQYWHAMWARRRPLSGDAMRSALGEGGAEIPQRSWLGPPERGALAAAVSLRAT